MGGIIARNLYVFNTSMKVGDLNLHRLPTWLYQRLSQEKGAIIILCSQATKIPLVRLKRSMIGENNFIIVGKMFSKLSILIIINLLLISGLKIKNAFVDRTWVKYRNLARALTKKNVNIIVRILGFGPYATIKDVLPSVEAVSKKKDKLAIITIDGAYTPTHIIDELRNSDVKPMLLYTSYSHNHLNKVRENRVKRTKECKDLEISIINHVAPHKGCEYISEALDKDFINYPIRMWGEVKSRLEFSKLKVFIKKGKLKHEGSFSPGNWHQDLYKMDAILNLNQIGLLSNTSIETIVARMPQIVSTSNKNLLERIPNGLRRIFITIDSERFIDEYNEAKSYLNSFTDAEYMELLRRQGILEWRERLQREDKEIKLFFG